MAGAVAGAAAGWTAAAVVLRGDGAGEANVLVALGLVALGALVGSPVGCYVALRAVDAERSGTTAAWLTAILVVGALLGFTGVAPIAAITVGPILARRLALRGPGRSGG
ncbi:MAG: hypothetical protein ACLGIO_14490 [Acidimicrobiia bacterium]